MIAGLAWVIAVSLGLLVGGFMFHFPGNYGEPTWSVSAAVIGFLLGAINGVVVGTLGWVALRLSRGSGARLVAAMALIVGGTHALNDGASTQAPFVVIQGLAGLIALSVWAWIFAERRSATLAVIGGAWTLGLILGQWSGDVLGLPLTETPMGWAQDHAWDGLVTGLVWGITTAAIGVPAQLRAANHVPARTPTPGPC